jgi:hypothetical protein
MNIKEKNVVRIAELLYNHKDRGYSVNAINSVPTEGFMVSLEKYETKVDTEVNEVLLYNIQQFVSKHYDLVSYSRALFFGIWQDDGIYYLDVSEQIQDRDVAIRVAKLNNQIAYYDVRGKKSYKV